MALFHLGSAHQWNEQLNLSYWLPWGNGLNQDHKTDNCLILQRPKFGRDFLQKGLTLCLKQQLTFHLLNYFSLVPDTSWSFSHYKTRLMQQRHLSSGLQTLKALSRLQSGRVIGSGRKYLYVARITNWLHQGDKSLTRAEYLKNRIDSFYFSYSVHKENTAYTVTRNWNSELYIIFIRGKKLIIQAQKK